MNIRRNGVVISLLVILLLVGMLFASAASAIGTGETLIYHEIQVDGDGMISPWYSEDPAVAYDHNMGLLFNWWNNLEICSNGVPYFMQHQVWHQGHDSRGLGGDQLAMALSSWRLLHAYSGDPAVLANMIYIADYYLDHSLSSPTAAWPNLPYPYNTDLHSGWFDGDMVAGYGVTQPDKAGSIASELVALYETTGTARYLDAAVDIADTLADKVVPGDNDNSPWPFRVNAESGSVVGSYTSNWTGTLRLFDELIRLNEGSVSSYTSTRATLGNWLQAYPMQTNKWGPFFEDVRGWSDTETNADELARYVLENPGWSTSWQTDGRTILNWTYSTFGNYTWSQYGVVAINEQTAYPVPGNSHTSRHYSVELIYAEKTGDASRKAEAIRGLNWATYMVDFDGKNRYPQNSIWLTDGYGDYVRHYLRSMAAAPELSPAGQSHILRTSSVVLSPSYAANSVSYSTFDDASRELLRIAFTPISVTAGGVALPQLSTVGALDGQQGYTYEAPGDVTGVLRIRHDNSRDIEILGIGDSTSTIGFTGDGTVPDVAGASYVNGFRYQATSPLTVDTMRIRIATAASGHMKLAIYADNAGVLGNFLRGTNERSGLGTGWQSFTLSSPLDLAQGNHYWLVIWCDDQEYYISAIRESGAPTYAPANYTSTWPSPFPPGTSHGNYRYSLYAEGTGVVYEDGEDGEVLGWDVYDASPAGATISNVYDSAAGSQVLKLSGTGTKNGFRLRREDGPDWGNSERDTLEIDLRFSEGFVLYVDVDTALGQRYLTYRPGTNANAKNGNYLDVWLGEGLVDGNWASVRRNLQTDLSTLEPGNTLRSVDAILIRGSGSLDNVKLIDSGSGGSGSEFVYEDAEDGNLLGWDVYDAQPAGATITNVYDSSAASRVVQLTGSGTPNGYRLRSGSGENWQDTEHDILEIDVRFFEGFILYMYVDTALGRRYLQYMPGSKASYKDRNYLYFPLGEGLTDGNWVRIRTDLQADLQSLEPGNALKSVDALLIRGSGAVDNVKLLGDAH